MMNIAIIGCGEVGCMYAISLINAGYSLQLCAPRPSEKVLQFTSQKNVPLHKEIGDWLSNIDIAISCTPGSTAFSVVSEAVQFLKSNSLFADFSSSSANDKRKSAELAQLKKILFADVVIMGGVDLTKEKTPLLCAGTGSEKIAELMKKLNAPIRILPNAKAGDAASLKLLRTVFMKGLSALTVECFTAAEYHGVKELLYDILSDFEQTPLNEFLDMLLRNHVTHACRQRHEIADAIAQSKLTGLPVKLLSAVEALFATTCDNIKLHPIETPNPTTQEALNWLIKTRLNKK